MSEQTPETISIRRLPRITFSCLHAYPDEVLLQQVVEMGVDGCTSGLVAGAKIQNRNRQDGYDYFSIDYHIGNQSWMFHDEWAHTARGRHRHMLLHEAIECFEKAVGVDIPPIVVTLPGKGLWIAQQPAKVVNPWRLEENTEYRCFNKDGRRKEFTTRKDENGNLLLQVRNSDGEAEERFQESFLSLANWKSLQVVDPETGVGSLLVDDLKIMDCMRSLSVTPVSGAREKSSPSRIGSPSM